MEQGQPRNDHSLEDEAASVTGQPDEAATEPVLAADDLAFPANSPARSRFASVARGVTRMLLAFVFSQYVITTVLVAAVAIILSRTASGFLAEKFDALARAIQNF